MKKITKSAFLFVLAFIFTLISACTPETPITVNLDKTARTVKAGESVTLTATVSVEGKTVEWLTSDPATATVKDGVVTGVKTGTATITAKVDEIKAYCTITVVAADVITVELNRQTADICVGDVITLTATVKVNNQAAERDVVWTSSDENVATVENGKVTAAAAGETTIKASSGAAYTECVITVSDIVILSFNKASVNADIGADTELKGLLEVKVNDVIDNSKAVTWTSSDEAILTVNETGIVTPVKAGKAQVTAEAEGESATITVYVYKTISNAEEFLSIKDNLTGNYRLTANIDFNNATVEPLAPYPNTHTGDWNPVKNMFAGIFDGAGYTLSNFNLPVAATKSLFGVTDITSVIKNLNIYNAVINKEGCAVISDWNKGKIENIFIYSVIKAPGHTQANNYTGSIAQKNYGDISNVIAYCEVPSEIAVTGIGAVVGTQRGGIINDCYAVSRAAAVRADRYPNTPDKLYADGESHSDTVKSFADLAALLESADLASFDSALWAISEDNLPVLKNFDNALIATAEITNTETGIFAGDTLQITVNGKLLAFKMQAAVNGISVSESGLISVEKSVAKDTVFTVEIYSLIDGNIKDSIELKVDKVQEQYTESYIVDKSETGETVAISFPYDISKITNNNKEIAFTKSGADYIISRAAFAESGEQIYYFEVPECVYAVPVTVADKILKTAADLDSLVTVSFDETSNNYTGYYLLGNNIDYQGGVFTTIAHYDNTGAAANNWVPLNKMFNATLNGNGFVISNINTQTSGNSGIIGVLGAQGVLKNIGFINISINCTSGGVVAYNSGTVKNVMVDAVISVNGHASLNNSTGGIIGKNVTGAKVDNCIAAVSVGSGVTNMTTLAALIGNSGNGVVNNSYSVSCLPAYRAAGGGAKTNVIGYNDSSALAAADFSTFDSSVWNKQEGCVPSLKGYTGGNVTITGEETAVYSGTGYKVNVSSTGYAGFALSNTVEGVYVDQYGMVSVESFVPSGTAITVKIYNIFDTSKFIEKQLNVSVREAGQYSAVIADLSDSAITDLSLRFETAVTEIKINDTAITFTQAENFITIQNYRTQLSITDNFTGAGEFALKLTTAEGVTEIKLIIATKVIMTAQEFANMKTISYSENSNNYTGYYLLGADINMSGASCAPIAPYGETGAPENNWVPKYKMFNATFNGNGHTISNFAITVNDGSLFGVIGSAGIVKNLNIDYAVIAATKAGTISAFNMGTIQNIFARVCVTVSGADAGNPTGGLVGKNAGGTIKNVIVEISLGNGASGANIGAIAGYPQTNSTQKDCLAVVGNTGIKAFRNTAKLDTTPPTATAENCAVYVTSAELIAAQDFANFGDDVWVKIEGALPMLRII